MSGESSEPKHYDAAGVSADAASSGLKRLGAQIQQTFGLRDGKVGRPLRGLGYYANVLDMGGGLGLAVSCDGVGTKILVAEHLNRYDTIGIDLVAMNVNDLICVGAEPIAMLDYIAVGKVCPEVFEAIGRGLLSAATECSISIPGGEIAQIGAMLKGHGRTEGLDLVGTAVGTVRTDRMLFGQDVKPGDVVVGLASSGLHSNGFTLARRVLAKSPEDYERFEPQLGRTLGQELLIPTALYVRFANELFASGLDVHAVCHITGDGFLNLCRVEAPIGFVLDQMPEPLPVFRLIAERGGLDAAEMYTVFNMGVGLCVILPESQAERVIALATAHGHAASLIGRVTAEDGLVKMPGLGLEGGRGTALRAV